MVNKSNKSTSGGKVKVGKMKLNKETVKNLSAAEKKLVKGGKKPQTGPSLSCIICVVN